MALAMIFRVISLWINFLYKQTLAYLKKSSSFLASIASISEEITAKIIENISGEPMNQSSIKATIQETIKKNIGKHAWQ